MTDTRPPVGPERLANHYAIGTEERGRRARALARRHGCVYDSAPMLWDAARWHVERTDRYESQGYVDPGLLVGYTAERDVAVAAAIGESGRLPWWRSVWAWLTTRREG